VDPARGDPSLRRVTTTMVISTPSLAAVKAHSRQVISDVAGTHRASDHDQERNPRGCLLVVEDHGPLIETLDSPLRSLSRHGHPRSGTADGAACAHVACRPSDTGMPPWLVTVGFAPRGLAQPAGRRRSSPSESDSTSRRISLAPRKVAQLCRSTPLPLVPVVSIPGLRRVVRTWSDRRGRRHPSRPRAAGRPRRTIEAAPMGSTAQPSPDRREASRGMRPPRDTRVTVVLWGSRPLVLKTVRRLPDPGCDGARVAAPGRHATALADRAGSLRPDVLVDVEDVLGVVATLHLEESLELGRTKDRAGIEPAVLGRL
jgi:hypothetical protein